MRKFLLPLFCCVLSLASAQDPSLFLVPRWKVGDTRTLTINSVRTEMENDSTTEEREEVQARVRVVNEDPKNYIIRIEYDNVVLRQADKLMQATGGASTPVPKLTLRYAVDRMDGSHTLENWEEVQRTVKASFKEVDTRLQADMPEMATAFNVIMLPILSVFDSKENVEAYFNDVIQYITFPLGKQLVEGDTLHIDEYGSDPFGSGVDSMQVTTLISLKRIDRVQQQAVVRGELRYDIASFMGALKGMMQQMMSAFTDDPKAKRKAEAEMKQVFDTMRFDITNEQLHTVDLRNSWPISCVSSARIVMRNAERNSTITTLTTVTVSP